MRGRTILLIALLAILGLLPDVANAQLSPQGVLGSVTRPFRQMLGRFGHYPRRHYYRTAQQDRRHEARLSGSKAAPGQGGPRLTGVGPIAWPTAFEDVLGYTFWPNSYAAEIRGRGFDVITDSLTGTPRGAATARATTTGATVQSDSDGNSA
jgi:hypothetical protein